MSIATNGREGNGRLNIWFQNVRLSWLELKLRFHLHRSKAFKIYCEKRGCPNLAGLEQEYIFQLRAEIARLKKRRLALRNASVTQV